MFHIRAITKIQKLPFSVSCGNMVRTLLLTIILSFPGVATSQEPREASKSVRPTKLEALSAQPGTVLVVGYSLLGTVYGTGQISIDVREHRDLSKPKFVQYGVSFHIKDSGGLESTSFVDEDEIDQLMSSLDYISKIDSSVTTFRYFGAQYQTKGGLSFMVITETGGKPKLSVSSEKLPRSMVLADLSDIKPILSYLTEAKKKIESAKTEGR